LDNKPNIKEELESILSGKGKGERGSKRVEFMEGLIGKAIILILFACCVVAMSYVFVGFKDLHYYVHSFLSISIAYFLGKMILSFFYRPVKGEAEEGLKVSVVIPSFNEDPDAVVKSILALLKQDYPIHEIIFVDDGSKNDAAYYRVLNLKHLLDAYREASPSKSSLYKSLPSKHVPNLIVHKFEENKGKRHAQVWGFRQATGDYFMLYDSDSQIYKDTLTELLKPFRNKKISSVVGHINVQNRDTNILTRLQDVIYQSAFRVGRAAQSVTGSVLVCSGALAVHKKEYIIDTLDEFLTMKVFGIGIKNGDDRVLTLMALRNGGKTKYQSTAICLTNVPTKLNVYFKQQVRWCKSFYLHTIKSLKYAWKRPFMLMWLVCEGSMWILFGLGKIFTIYENPDIPLTVILVRSFVYLIIAALTHGIYYVFRHPILFLAVPIFSIMHMFILMPVRLWALITIKKTAWGTR